MLVDLAGCAADKVGNGVHIPNGGCQRGEEISQIRRQRGRGKGWLEWCLKGGYMRYVNECGSWENETLL